MIRIVLTEPQAGATHGLKSLLTEADNIEIAGLCQDGMEAAQIAIQTRPDVLLVHEKLPATDGYEVCRLVKMAAPEVGCVLLVEQERPPVVQMAMRAGANAVLSPAAKLEDIIATIENCAGGKNIKHSEAYAAVTDPTRMPITVGLISAKDGVGKTTLAVNLAVLLAKRYPGTVVLMDMYAQLGDVNLLLNVPAQGSLVDLVAYADELDAELIETHLTAHRSGLRILSGSTTPAPVGLDQLTVPYIAALLGILRRNYRFTICDLPSTLWSGSLYVLSRCQEVLVVSNLFELTTIRDTNSLLRIIVDGGYVSESNVRLVVNRSSPKDRFTVTDLEEATGMNVRFTLRNDTETVIAAANRGEPFILDQSRAPISQDIAGIADLITESAEEAAEERAA